MVDINLLPEELRNKNSELGNNKSSFDLDEIEFTSGEKLESDSSSNGRLVSGTPLTGWVKEKMSNSFKMSKDKNDNQQDEKRKPNFNRDILDKDSFIKVTENKKLGGFLSKLFSKKKKEEDRIIVPEKIKISDNLNKNLKPNLINSDIKDTVNNVETPKDKKIIYTQNSEIQKKVIAVPVPEKQQGFNFKAFIDKLLETKTKTNSSSKIDVNLLPDMTSSNASNPFTTLLSILLVSVILLCAIYFGVNIYKTKAMQEGGDLDKDLQDSMNQVDLYKNVIVDLQSWQDKAAKINTLFEKHIYWSEFFKSIEENTLPSVSYSNFSGGLDGNLSLAATAPDYQTVVRQWMYLKTAKNFAKNVIITGASLSQSSKEDTGSVSFSITLDLADNIFYYKNK